MKNLNATSFELNGQTFSVEPSVSGDYYNCFASNGVEVLNDSACEDYYGPIDEVAERMADVLKEEASKLVPWWDLLGAVITSNADASRIDFDEEARQWGQSMDSISVVDDPEEFEDAKLKLDFDRKAKVNKIYKFTDNAGVHGYFVLEQDY